MTGEADRRAASATDLCIIGGGPSAIALLTHLAERLSMNRDSARPRNITIVEKTGQFGVGTPWRRQENLPQHLSSLPGGASRAAFGDRQPERLRALTNYLEPYHVNVRLVANDEVLDVTRRENSLDVQLASRLHIACRFAILATGHWRAEQPLPAEHGFTNAWPAVNLQRKLLGSISKPPLTLLVLGTYLSGVDSVITAAHALGEFQPSGDGQLTFSTPHDFSITMASRQGILPDTWSERFSPHRCAHFLPDESTSSLQALYALLRKELDENNLLHHAPAIASHAEVSELAAYLRARPRRHAETFLTSRLRMARRDGPAQPAGAAGAFRDVQAVLFGTLHLLSEAFHRLPAADQQLFQQQLRGAYFAHAMPMPPESTAKLLAMLKSGHLEVLRLGHHYTLRRHAPASPFCLSGATGGRQFSCVVDARGQCRDIEQNPSSLFANLRRRGEIQPAIARGGQGAADLVTGGIYVNPSTCEVIARPFNAPQQMTRKRTALFAMGPNLVGQFPDAQSRGQLDRDARRILSEIEDRLAIHKPPQPELIQSHAQG